MKLLPFNTRIQLRAKPGIALTILPFVVPIGLLFLYFVEFSIFELIATAYRLEWFLFCTALILLFVLGIPSVLLIGYITGWLMNGLTMLVFLNWPLEKVKRTLLYSEPPEDWLQSDAIAPQVRAQKQLQALLRIQAQGKLRFICKYGIGCYGSSMFISNGILPMLMGNSVVSFKLILLRAAIWLCVGAAFGLIMWHISARQLKKLTSEQHPLD